MRLVDPKWTETEAWLWRAQLLCVVVGCFFGVSQAQATTYFSWGVESPANNAYTYSDPCGTGESTPSVKQVWVSPWAGNTVQDCTISHTGSCSMKMTVIGADGGNQQAGPDTCNYVPLPFTAQSVSGSGSIYYRTWMRFSADFNWGSPGVANVKTSRASNGSNSATQRFFTGHMRSGAILMAECEYVPGYGGGCLTTSGTPSNDYNIGINFDFQGKADGLWHEYIWRVKPNTGSTSNAEMQLFVDGISRGTLIGWKLVDEQNDVWNERWGGWMARPYWQMNGDYSVGGTVWVDDVSTDDQWNSTFLGGGDTTPPAMPTGLAAT